MINQTAIVGPFFATILLTFVVWVYMYIRRIRFITSSSLTQEQLITPGVFAQLSPPAVNNPSDNLKNLFEIPVLFYVLALYLFATLAVWFIALRAGLAYLGI